MSLRNARRLIAPVVAWFSVAASAAGSAQRVLAYSEPSPCTIFFQPNEKVTHHAGGLFEVGWWINFPQYGPVWYYGKPNPVISDDGTKKWTNPSANVTCYTDWYYLYPTTNMDATFRWHINEYGGTVTSCDSGGGGNVGGTGFTDIGMDPGYDPYGTYDPGGGSCGEPGETGSPSGGNGFVCHTEYIYIEISYDGGKTWEGWWQGYATICES